MQAFFERIIKPYIIEKKYKDICEIGARYGENTDKLLSIDSIKISVIDPCLDSDLCTKYEKSERVHVYKGLSLEILPKISQKFDCFLIDADHNWYTVVNELKTIREKELLRKGGTIFFHDVCWPYGRRDMYYIPESIPEKFRHPYMKKGIERGLSELSERSNFDKDLNNAIYEGGEKNGVLTAIEDFLNQFPSEYLFFYYKVEFGLGFLIRKRNTKMTIFSFKWFYRIKYYETRSRVVSIIRRRWPVLYLILLKIKDRLKAK